MSPYTHQLQLIWSLILLWILTRMKRFDKYILAFISVASVLFTSCVKEELIEGKLDLDKIYSKKIIFSASAGWGENEDVITKSGAASYGNRIGNRTLSTNDIFDDKALTISPTIFSNGETISIESDSEIKDVKMVDMLGRKMNVSVNNTNGTSCQVNINQKCNSGIYLIIVETEEGEFYEKVVVRN